MTDGDGTRGESFLVRRARLKAERQRQEARAPAQPSAPGEADGQAVEPRRLTDADMPPLESLDADSDFSQFLAEGVSDALRRAALRKLFRLPEFNVLDGLNDYDDDYTKLEKLGDVMTYQKRLMAEREAAKREATVDQPSSEVDRASSRDEPDAAETPGTPEVADGDQEVEDDGDLEA
ncbi:MAG: DUF3306 domain-containing protein [Gammaproteobacteria bacterium]|nr:DUF3306 domain-containing protein [Gammaproteobacteria bacterium]